MKIIYQVGCARASGDNLLHKLNKLQRNGHLIIDEVGECDQFIVIITTEMSKADVIRAIKQGRGAVEYLTVRYLAVAKEQVLTPAAEYPLVEG